MGRLDGSGVEGGGEVGGEGGCCVRRGVEGRGTGSGGAEVEAGNQVGSM